MSQHADGRTQTFAEKAAWSFCAKHNPKFDLAVINNTYTFGPLPRSLTSGSTINTSNQRIQDLVTGAMRSGIQPTAPVFTFVDVRDVALAHVRAMTVPEAGGKRFYVVGGYFSNPRIAGIIRRRFPELCERGLLPPRELAEDMEDFPEDHWAFDNSRSKDVLGLDYRGLEESVVDAVKSILKLGEGA
jgi:nucleoside-diphosphate-sugar epimerase